MNKPNYNSYLILGVVVVVVVFLFIFGLLNDKTEDPLAEGNIQEGELIQTDNQEEDAEEEDATPTLSAEYTDEDIVRELVLGFNDEWIEYVNNSSTELLNYIRPGTQIENSIMIFETEGLTEELMDIQITDVQIDGDIAYIYDKEVFKHLRDGEESFKEYEWVYTARKVDGIWLLESYD